MRILTGRFLEALFPDRGPIECRALRGSEVKRDFACSVRSALAFYYRVKDTNDLYFGVAARVTPYGGGKANLAYAAALWVDIDAEDAGDRLRSSGLPSSSILVASGTRGHLHAYWLLRKPVPLRTPEAIAAFEARLRGITAAAGGDRACVDAGRVLRMPNSRNFKHTPPTYVDILSWRPDRHYDVEDFPPGEVLAPSTTAVTDAVESIAAVETEWVRDILDKRLRRPAQSGQVGRRLQGCLLPVGRRVRAGGGAVALHRVPGHRQAQTQLGRVLAPDYRERRAAAS